MSTTTVRPTRHRKDRPPRSKNEILSDAKRMVLAFGRSAGQGTPEHLAMIKEMRQTVREAENLAYAGLRSRGFSDQSIAQYLGITPGAVKKRFPRG